MPFFRKKPIVVVAYQFFADRPVPTGVEFDDFGGQAGRSGPHLWDFPRPYVTTIHGQKAYLDDGDWVITESDGVHHYPCKPDEFDRIYEPINPVQE